MSNSLQPHRPVLCPWDFPGKNTGEGCHLLLQVIFLPRIELASFSFLAVLGEFFSTAPPENLRNVMTAHLLPESGSGLAGWVDPDL